MSSYFWPPSGVGTGVTSVNGLTGAITLAAGTNITLVPSGNTITINSTATPTGTVNTWAGFDGSGNLFSIPSWSSATARTLAIAASGAGVAGLSATLASGNSGAGTDLAGGVLNLSSGNSTGTGASSIAFKIPIAAGSTGAGVNTATTAMTLDGDYQLGLKGTGSGTFKQRAATNTTDYSVTWPSAQASGTRILENDGSGNLSWAAAGSAGAAIGSPISGGTPGSMLFVDVSGNLGQDNANNYWDTVNARLGLGTTAPNGKLHISDGTVPATAVIAAGTLNNGYLNITRNGSNQNNFASTTGTAIRFVRANTDLSAPTALTNGDSIFQMLMRGYDGSSNVSPATLSAIVNGSVSVGSIPMDWVFTTGTSTAVEAFRIKSTGVINIAGFSSTGIVHNDSSGNLSTSLVVNADVSASAAIAYSKLALTGSIVNADINASAAIAYSKLALTGSIVNADINASAAIAYSKLAAMTTGQILLGNAGVPTATTLGGDISVGATGTATIANSAITNAKVSASAAIDYSKLATLNTGQILLGNAGVPTATTLSGDVTVGATGVTAIGSGKVTNAMLAGSIDLTAKVTGVLPIANGGTNGTATPTAGAVAYGNGSAVAYTAAGTNGQYLISTAANAPVFISAPPPTMQKFTSGSGTYNKDYTFIITSGSATVGATYTNNSITFTVYATVSSATQVVMSGSGAPTANGTLTKATGTGDSTLTFSAFFAPSYILVEMVGGGGGGGGSALIANANGTTGSPGGNTTFGSSLLTCNGGGGGAGGTTQDDVGGAGGTATIAAGPIGFAISGGSGGAGGEGVATSYIPSGNGGNSALGGGGGDGLVGATNTGGGGGGAGAVNTRYGGGSGGAGGYIKAMITSPSATYAYAVGALGAGGAAGTSGTAGSNGGSGLIVVWEYYQ